ncbi:hypothetical protein KAR91_48845 [Candidatus Pacearchaeota archaeon]|nr:hypothetical protein [Candidatus Pacearchaeota archaeon]
MSLTVAGYKESLKEIREDVAVICRLLTLIHECRKESVCISNLITRSEILLEKIEPLIKGD